ncbi:hypothetical protein Lal_00012609 [Lupinus albus]|nr:hypothetical protein Lal_00012609 [Lupinus albus]
MCNICAVKYYELKLAHIQPRCTVEDAPLKTYSGVTSFASYLDIQDANFAILAIEFAHQNGWKSIWLKCDSSFVVDILNGNLANTPWKGARHVRAFDLRSSSPFSNLLIQNGVHCIPGDVVRKGDIEIALRGADDKNVPIHNIPDPEGVRGRNLDNTLIKEKLGWAPTMKLKDGLRITYFYKRRRIKVLIYHCMGHPKWCKPVAIVFKGNSFKKLLPKVKKPLSKLKATPQTITVKKPLPLPKATPLPYVKNVVVSCADKLDNYGISSRTFSWWNE